MPKVQSGVRYALIVGVKVITFIVDTRTINDLSILGKKVVLILESRKFFCKNADCSPKTFAE